MKGCIYLVSSIFLMCFPSSPKKQAISALHSFSNRKSGELFLVSLSERPRTNRRHPFIPQFLVWWPGDFSDVYLCNKSCEHDKSLQPISCIDTVNLDTLWFMGDFRLHMNRHQSSYNPIFDWHRQTKWMHFVVLVVKYSSSCDVTQYRYSPSWSIGCSRQTLSPSLLESIVSIHPGQ